VNLAVTQDLHYNAEVYTLSKQVRRRRIAEVMEPLPRQSQGCEECLKLVSQVIAGQGRPAFRAEDEGSALTLPGRTCLQPLLKLLSAVSPQELDKGRREGKGAPTLLGLRSVEMVLAPITLQGVAHRQRLGVEVNVSPCQPEQLALTESKADCKSVERREPVLRNGAK
jgi:hypothetical protein